MDSKDYLDTISVIKSLACNAEHLFGLIGKVSKGAGFTSPCELNYDIETKFTLLEFPSWFKP
jgi:hypothetical protein